MRSVSPGDLGLALMVGDDSADFGAAEPGSPCLGQRQGQVGPLVDDLDRGLDGGHGVETDLGVGRSADRAHRSFTSSAAPATPEAARQIVSAPANIRYI